MSANAKSLVVMVRSGLVIGDGGRIDRDIIIMPVRKDHGVAGITGALNIHYGSIHNPNKYHGGGCNPYIADLNNLEQIKSKQRLIVMDALKVQYQGGGGVSEALGRRLRGDTHKHRPGCDRHHWLWNYRKVKSRGGAWEYKRVEARTDIYPDSSGFRVGEGRPRRNRTAGNSHLTTDAFERKTG